MKLFYDRQSMVERIAIILATSLMEQERVLTTFDPKTYGEEALQEVLFRLDHDPDFRNLVDGLANFMVFQVDKTLEEGMQCSFN